MIWQEFGGVVIRWLIVGIAGALVGYGVISQDLANRIIEPANSLIFGLVILIVPVLMKIAKARFDAFQKEKLYLTNPAHKSPGDVKREVWNENKFVSPV